MVNINHNLVYIKVQENSFTKDTPKVIVRNCRNVKLGL